MLVSLVCLASLPATARAATITVHFANGGTAELHENGTITGTAYVGEWDDSLGTHFPVTMPDGAHKDGWCLKHGQYAPSAGYHPFTATPNGSGTYDIVIDTSGAPRNPRQVEGYDFVDPPQPVGDFTWAPELMGKLCITKSSELPNITNSNDMYDLKGAVYGVYSNKACTKSVGELVVGNDGKSDTLELSPGTYYIKEKDAPKGYITSATVYAGEVTAAKTKTVKVTETPIYEEPKVWATKTDAQYESAQGSASLAGAEFTVCYYDGIYTLNNLPAKPTRSWVLRSDEQGNVFPTANNLVHGSAFYINEHDEVVLPLGTLTIQETKAPAGYWLEGQTAGSPADYQAPVHLTTVDGTGSYLVPIAKEQVRRAGIVLRKQDAQTNGTPQGNATFEGISFAIVNKNEQAVVVNGATYASGDVVATITTNAQGVAQTAPDCLPLGTYEVVEASTNDSMLATCEPQTITLTTANTNQVVSLPKPMKDEVVRGGLRVGKISRELGEHLSQGEATLAGAVFEVTNESTHPVMVNGALFEPGAVVCTLVSNEEGVCETAERALPFGTYSVREVEPPQGYLPNEDWQQTVEVRNDGMVVSKASDQDSVDDQVMRGSFAFNKVDETSMERMAGTAWLVTSKTTGEAHVLVADENGIVDTEANPHSTSTNHNDKAWANGKLNEGELSPGAGVWFSGRADRSCAPDDGMRALPYDEYTVQELASEGNSNHKLVSFSVRIHKHDVNLNMGTVDDKRTEEVHIGTTLTYGNDHVAPVGGAISLVDTVSYQGLDADTEYTLVGTLHDRESGDAVVVDGEEVRASATFTPSTSIGSEQVVFELNSSELAGRSVVAYESLFEGERLVASHEDLEDEGQTVHFPTLGTSLTDVEGNREVRCDEIVRLVDTVSFANVVPGLRYEVEGTLVNKATGEALVDEAGQVVRASASFVPNEATGTVQATFTFVGSLAQGKTLVAFETLRHAGIDIATHANIDDADQTVHVPAIATTLTDAAGNHAIQASGTIVLQDAVVYSGLEPGATYTVTGTLMDKTTGEPLKATDNNPITSTSDFVAESADGVAQVSFTVDASLLAGKVVVAYESLIRDGREVAVHANLDDVAQTMYAPSVRTTLLGAQGTHEIEQDNVIVTDTVEYAGLCPQQTYTLSGTLMDKDTGKPLKDSADKDVVGSTTFVPQETSGTTEVKFTLDSRELGGRTLVAFESLHMGESTEGAPIATHDDLQNADQTVYVPQIRTTATNADDGGKAIADTGTAHVRDEVHYEGLVAGAEYIVEGTLYDKDTGRVLTDKSGKDLTARTTFVAKESSGSVTVDFEFDAKLVSGSGLVVFERCLREGRTIAVHENLHDEDQTLKVTRSKEDKKTEDKKTEDKTTTKQEKTTDTKAKKGTNTPGTGEEGGLMWLAAVLALLGASFIATRRLLR